MRIIKLLIPILFLAACSKQMYDPEQVNVEEVNNLNSNATLIQPFNAGDGQWDVLGYGYDVTKNYLDPLSVSKFAVLDIERFAQDQSGYISSRTPSFSDSHFYNGFTASDFISDINKHRTFNASITGGSNEPSDSVGLKFTASFGTDRTNHNIKEVKSRFSYARFESELNLKQVYIHRYVNLNLLQGYLNTNFLQDVNTLSTEQLINLYGTHVLLDVTLGGRLSFNYVTNTSTETNTENKKRKTEGGLGFFISMFGFSLKGSQTTTEMTKHYYESVERDMNILFYGGTTHGQAITFDANGNASGSISVQAWQQSVNQSNSVLTDIEWMVPLHHFITDPSKKAAVKTAIAERIEDSQITHLQEVPIFQFHHSENQDYLFNLDINGMQQWQGWSPVGYSFYAFKTQKNGTVPIYGYRHNDHKRTVYNTKRDFIQPNWSGWDSGHITFYAYSNGNVPGTVPVYEFYNENNKCNTYSTNINAVTGYPGWTTTGIAFYALPKN